jgi:hypothetical protein
LHFASARLSSRVRERKTLMALGTSIVNVIVTSTTGEGGQS